MLPTAKARFFAEWVQFARCVNEPRSEHQYLLVLTPPAERAIRRQLPESVAAGVIEFLTSGLLTNPARAGRPLRGQLTGIYEARRGTYRVLYRINETDREVIVLQVKHRRDAYRSQ